MPGERAAATAGLNGPPSRTRASRRLAVYLGLGAAGLLAALAFQRAELIALVAPFLLLVTASLAGTRPPLLSLEARQPVERALEGTEVELTLSLSSDRAVWGLTLELEAARGISARRLGRAVGEIRPGVQLEERWLLACQRWGGRRSGRL